MENLKLVRLFASIRVGKPTEPILFKNGISLGGESPDVEGVQPRHQCHSAIYFPYFPPPYALFSNFPTQTFFPPKSFPLSRLKDTTSPPHSTIRSLTYITSDSFIPSNPTPFPYPPSLAIAPDYLPLYLLTKLPSSPPPPAHNLSPFSRPPSPITPPPPSFPSPSLHFKSKHPSHADASRCHHSIRLHSRAGGSMPRTKSDKATGEEVIATSLII